MSYSTSPTFPVTHGAPDGCRTAINPISSSDGADMAMAGQRTDPRQKEHKEHDIATKSFM